ncbi:MAG: hypothetical protein JJ973_00070 [Rhodospirillales bacterium]|nr:hypothetical protein [Rhodospirillales bacterium]
MSAGAAALIAPLSGPAAHAQERGADIGRALSRLSNNPRYRGRVLGTHVRRQDGRVIYEVRILRPDDRVILVYLDAETGGVVGDSERSERNDIRRALRNPGNDRKPKLGNGFNN